MSGLTSEEIDEMVKAMSFKPVAKETKIPLRPPGSYKTIAKVALSPIEGEIASPRAELTERDFDQFGSVKAEIKVLFGKNKFTLKELAALEEGHLIPLEDLCDDLVDIYVNGSKIGRGEIVAVDDHFGVKIIAFTKRQYSGDK